MSIGSHDEPTAPAALPDGTVVRQAGSADTVAVAVAVAALLSELGGKPPAQAALSDAAQTLIGDSGAGVLLLAEAPGERIVGLLGASFATAVRIPGRYGTIEELWVDPDWRSRGVGTALLAAICELANARGLARLEVGLPSERFAQLAATEAFYRSNGFTEVGLRMRRLL